MDTNENKKLDEKDHEENLNIKKDTEHKEHKEESDQTEDTSSQEEEKAEEGLLEEITSLKEEKIRLLAEMENLRKRFEKEKIDSIKFGSMILAKDILSPGDNLERALSAIPKEENMSQSLTNLIDGLKMVLKEYHSALEKNGIKKIESLDKKFDHNYHQAIMEIEEANVEEGTVIQEIQTGYTIHERLLRPAMVGVSKKPSKKEDKKNHENDEDDTKNQENE